MGQSETSDDTWGEFMQEFARSLQRIRTSRGYSQDQVAYAAGISRSAYQRLERGEILPGNPTNPTLKNLIPVAQVLEVTIDELLPENVPDMRAGTPRASKPRKR